MFKIVEKNKRKENQIHEKRRNQLHKDITINSGIYFHPDINEIPDNTANLKGYPIELKPFSQ